MWYFSLALLWEHRASLTPTFCFIMSLSISCHICKSPIFFPHVHLQCYVPCDTRRHASDEDGDTPATKRPEEEARHVLGNTFLNDSSESDHVAKTTTVATTKKIIKIRRTSTSNYHSGSTNVHVPSEKVHVHVQMYLLPYMYIPWSTDHALSSLHYVLQC